MQLFIVYPPGDDLAEACFSLSQARPTCIGTSLRQDVHARLKVWDGVRSCAYSHFSTRSCFVLPVNLEIADQAASPLYSGVWPELNFVGGWKDPQFRSGQACRRCLLSCSIISSVGSCPSAHLAPITGGPRRWQVTNGDSTLVVQAWNCFRFMGHIIFQERTSSGRLAAC